MIGNDVVDLKLATTESNWKRTGYLDKIFTSVEQEFIFNAKNKTEMVWVLWSIKESVYKASLRIDYDRGFYPSKIEITSLKKKGSEYNSIIKLKRKSFHALSKIAGGCIHTIATNFDYQLSNVYNLESNTPYFKDENGLPLDYSNNYISISHHGNFKKIICYR